MSTAAIGRSTATIGRSTAAIGRSSKAIGRGSLLQSEIVKTTTTEVEAYRTDSTEADQRMDIDQVDLSTASSVAIAIIPGLLFVVVVGDSSRFASSVRLPIEEETLSSYSL